jgi:NADPH2:quinone reductase
VASAAVNFPDVLLVAGRYQLDVPPPFVAGSEVAGTVGGVAADVTGIAVGDRVTGTSLVGAFAEEAVVGARAVQRVPDGVDLRCAAAAGVGHRTAYHALVTVGAVGAGDHVVVLGAGGGVGLAAVQIAVALGATVTAVASSTEKLDAARAHGATHLVDHRREDVREALRAAVPAGADVAVDPVGGPLSEPVLRSLRWGGRFVIVGFASGEIPRVPLNLVLLKGVHVLGFQLIDLMTHRPDAFLAGEREVAALVGSGAAVPHVGATFPLERTAEALRLVADGRAVGKVVIDVAPEP